MFKIGNHWRTDWQIIPIAASIKAKSLIWPCLKLHLLVAGPTLTTRIQLFEENKCVLEDLIIRSSTGFPILKVHASQLEQRFLKLIEFVLSRSSSAHLLMRRDSENVDPGVEKREMPRTPLVKLVDATNATIPFIDESRLIASPTLGEFEFKLF